MNCKSKDIIYTIACQTCGGFYRGQTENLRNRVALHKERKASNHLHNCSKGNFEIKPIYQST